MFAGFDYGTSNCAIGIIRDGSDEPELLPLDGGKPFMPSLLYALERELICESVASNIQQPRLRDDYLSQRQGQLQQAHRVRREHDIGQQEQSLYLGREAFEQYIALPEDGYFVKSPKSFLGASGLPAASVQFFEDLVTAMMQGIKQRADSQLAAPLRHAVIGRPVNFQGLNASDSNRQALAILNTAARRAGFESIEFLFEPLAAGMDFEMGLQREQIVLVVDIGGGTSDCAMVRMGPQRCQTVEREDDFLGHSGERVGGNDLDIQLAGKQLMPLFGMNSTLKNDLAMPTQLFWQAVSTNDVAAQAEFNNANTEQRLQRLLLDTREPELLQRFIELREQKQNHQLLRTAEGAKIALSKSEKVNTALDYIEAQLNCTLSQQQFAEAVQRPLARISALITECITQAGGLPEIVYVTGGSAQSPALRQSIKQTLGDIEVVDGNHFGSVAAGLTLWAQRLFR